MKALVLKYYKYASYEGERKFSYPAAFAGCNAVCGTLKKVAGVDSISLFVPDDEFAKAQEHIHVSDIELLPFSKLKETAWIAGEEKVLAVDEQAFYVPEEFFQKTIDASGDSGFSCWNDPEKLLSSFAYIYNCYFAVMPGAFLLEHALAANDFGTLFAQVEQRQESVRIQITPQDMPSFFRCYSQMNPYPYHFAVEPTSMCDSRCIMCPFHSPDPEIAKSNVYLGTGGENMPLEKFKKIMDDIAEIPWTYLPVRRKIQITAQLRGEPLLAPNFKAMCRCVKEHDFRLSFSTNGNTLGKNDYIDFFMEIGLDEIIISIDPDKESFLHVRPQLNYETVIKNVEDIYQRRKDSGKKYPTIYTKTVVLRGKKVDFRSVAERFSAYSDMVGFAYENYVDYKTDSKGYSDYFFKVDKSKRLPCLLITDVAVIHANGDMMICYGYPVGHIGNCFDKNVLDILKNSSMRQDIIKAHQNGDYHLFDYCAQCSSWEAQYNKVEHADPFTIYKNPVLAYWAKDKEPEPAVPQQEEDPKSSEPAPVPQPEEPESSEPAVQQKNCFRRIWERIWK